MLAGAWHAIAFLTRPVQRGQLRWTRVLIELRVKVQRPLVDLDVASVMLCKTRPELISLIEQGRIYWAWNLASDAQGRIPLIRVLARSLEDFIEGRQVTKAGPLEFQGVLRQIFPNDPAAIPSGKLAHAWSVSPDQVLKLWRAGFLRAAKGSICRPGPGGSPRFQFGSVASFLFQRRFGL
jgi:hypothetical protein